MARYQYNDEDNRMDVCVPDIYAGTITWSEDRLTKGKNPGNDQIGLRFELDDNKVGVFDNLTFTAKAGWRIDTFLKATGHQPDAKGKEVELTADMIVGWRAWLNVGVEPDPKVQGKNRNVIINYILDKGVPPVTPEVEQHKGNDPF